MPSKKPAEKKSATKKEKKKDPILKFVGKKTNDGHKIIGINRKKIERVNQPVTEMLELVLESGERTVVTEETLKTMIAKKNGKK